MLFENLILKYFSVFAKISVLNVGYKVFEKINYNPYTLINHS